MWLNHYEAERIMEERVKDALRKAEQARLIRAAKGPRKSRRGRWPVMLILKSLLAIFTDRRVDEPRRRSPSTAPRPTRKRCSGS